LLPGIRSHHERYDGKGYPDGLAGEDIPLLARILAVADAYDAMSTCRPYRDSLSLAEVEKRLTEGAGTHWDPRGIAAFLSRKERIHQVRQRGVGESLRQALDGVLRARSSSRPFQQPPLPDQVEASTEATAPRPEVPGLQTGSANGEVRCPQPQLP